MREGEIQNQILDFLNMLPMCVAWRNNNVGVYDPIRRVYRKPRGKYHLNGISDILGFYGDRFLAIEVKTPKGKISDAQKDFIRLVQSAGHLAGVARSIDDAKKILGIE